MEKSIKKLLAKKPLTADEAGRVMILDLLAAYKSLADGGEGIGVLSDEEKKSIVFELADASEIQRFNDYRSVHDFLMTVGAVYESYLKTFEVYYWKLNQLFMVAKYARFENLTTAKNPVIMTKLQYESFKLSGDPMPPGGIAVLQDFPDYASESISEDGFYIMPEPSWRRRFMAENIVVHYYAFIKENLDGIKDMLAECYARRKALEMIGRFIKVPQVKTLIIPVDENKISILNLLMSDIITSAEHPTDKTVDTAAVASLRSLLTPIDISAFEPEPKSVSNARRVLNFPFIKNNSETFTAMLKREWRNDCP